MIANVGYVKEIAPANLQATALGLAATANYIVGKNKVQRCSASKEVVKKVDKHGNQCKFAWRLKIYLLLVIV